MILKKWMKKNGLTQSDVAKAVGCSVTTISNIANGKFPDSVDILIELEKLTKGEVTIEELIKHKKQNRHKHKKQ